MMVVALLLWMAAAESTADAIKREVMKIKPGRVMILGRPAGGKSTLLNTLFGEELAETGYGKPITTEFKDYTVEGYGIVIRDSPGIELSEERPLELQLGNIRDQLWSPNQSLDSSKHIHAVIYTMSVNGRIEGSDEHIWDTVLEARVPLAIVLTHAIGSEGEQLFEEKVVEVLAEHVSRVHQRTGWDPVNTFVVAVNSVETTTKRGSHIPVFGYLSEGKEKGLLEFISDAVDQGRREADRRAREMSGLANQIEVAEGVIEKAATSMGRLAGWVFIPVVDLPVLYFFDKQHGMVEGIAGAFGVMANKEFTKAMIAKYRSGWYWPKLMGGTLLKDSFGLLGTVAGSSLSAHFAYQETKEVGYCVLDLVRTKALDNQRSTGATAVTAKQLLDSL
jgi:GTP-binding protein EngB required for normal cell division